MPHFRLETNVPQSKIPPGFHQKLCKVIATTMDKPIEYCAATIIGSVSMAFGGTTQPTAQATLISIGGLGVEENKKISKAIANEVAKDLRVPNDRMYIVFINGVSSEIGYKGTTFLEILGE